MIPEPRDARRGGIVMGCGFEGEYCQNENGEMGKLEDENLRLTVAVTALRRSLKDALAGKYLSRARRVLVQTQPVAPAEEKKP